MKREIFLVLLAFLFITPLISSTETNITIKTIPSHKIYLTVLDSSTEDFSAIDRIFGTSDSYGDSLFIYDSEESSFDLAVLIKNGDDTISYEKFREEFPAGEDVYLEVAPDGFEFIETPEKEEPEIVENSTLLNSTSETNTTEKSKESGITGLTLFGEEGILSSKVFYYVAAALFLFIVLFTSGFVIAKRIRNRETVPREIRIRKLSELRKSDEDIIEEAEKKIKEAQEEIGRIKNKGKMSDKDRKIEEAKKKLIEDEKRLMRLREGEED